MVKTKLRGDTLVLSMPVTNTGNTTCTFYCESRLQSPSGLLINNLVQSLTLSAGGSGTKTWTDTIPASWETGLWRVNFRVWNEDPQGGANPNATRLDDTTWVDAFWLTVPSVCTAIITGSSVT